MRLPVDGNIAIRSTIRPGTVLYFYEESFTSAEKHYFVVLNHAPLTDPAIFMLNATTNVAGRKAARAAMPAETLVEVGPANCPFLTQDSIFDCNSPTIHPIEVLIKKFNAGKLNLVADPAPSNLLDNLRTGVLVSPMVPEADKALLRKP